MDDGHLGDEAASRTASASASAVSGPGQHHHHPHPHQQQPYLLEQTRYQQHHRPQQPPPLVPPNNTQIPIAFQPHLLNSQHHQQSPISPGSASSSPFSPQSPTFDSPSRSSQLPLASYAAANLQAFTANSHLQDPPDPDDFYRSYRGVQSGDALSPVKDAMAAASAIPPPSGRPSLRSNGNGTTPRHPAVPSAARAPLRTNHRSASNPTNTVDDRQAHLSRQISAPGTGYSPGAGASVKDLKKKFDTTTASPSPRKTSTNLRPARDTGSSTTIGRPPTAGTGATSYGALRSPSTRDTAHDAGSASGGRATQRQKFVPEDQASANSQSFASRISRPRNPSVASSSHASTSTSLSQLTTTIPADLPSSPPPPSRPNGLLFGEILPEDSNAVNVGFGIEVARPRRTSESSVQPFARNHQRSFSDPDPEMEPESPTDWYRAAPVEQPPPTQRAPRTGPGHTRAHSDVAGSRLIKPRTTAQRERGSSRQGRADMTPTSPTSPTSRLPVLTKKNTSRHPTPLSTRSNSPAILAKQPSTSGRSSRQHVTGTTRSKTPTGRAAVPATKTPSQTAGSSRKPPPSNIATSSSGRLNAYVSAPTPKLSPSLRSSRPRQSVATATTTASRKRGAEVGSSSQPPKSQRGAPKSDESAAATRRRKISVGPIDFAQRRETIKLAYSKSIRDTQAKEARQAAAERRRKELEVVARIKVEAEAATLATAAAAAAASAANSRAPSPASARTPDSETPTEGKMVDGPLRLTTNLPSLRAIRESGSHVDSPTLGIPGSFPGAESPSQDEEEIPESAVSTVSSVVTEFEQEAQTEPAQPDGGWYVSTAAIDHDLGISMPGAHAPAPAYSDMPRFSDPPPLQKRVSYQYPFDADGMDDEDEDDDVSIKISLDDPSVHFSPQLTPTRTHFGLPSEHKPHDDSEYRQPREDNDYRRPRDDEYARDDDYEPQPYQYSSPNYETTVTILGPGADFTSLYKDQLGSTRPAAQVPQADGPPVAAAPEIITSGVLPEDEHEPEEVQIGVEGLDRLEDFYTGPRLRDNVAALRDATPSSSSSDVHVSHQPPPSSAPYQRIPDTSHSLAVPALLSPANRLSEASAWTDFSFGSDDRDAGPASSVAHSHEHDMSERMSTSKLTASPTDLSCRGSIIGDANPSPPFSPSPFEEVSAPPSMLAESPRIPHRFRDSNTGDGFAIPYSTESRTIPVLPDHDPPPPPLSGVPYRLEDPVQEAGTRPSSYLQDDEATDVPEPQADLARTSTRKLPSEAPPASSASSLQHKVQPSESSQLQLTEEQKRLRQRQLVIRELVDTEDVFVRDMSVVEEIYKGTAEACPKLDSKTIKLVFRNTDEIIGFHATFLAQIKEAVSGVYTPKGRRSPVYQPESSRDSDSVTLVSTHSGGTTHKAEVDDEKDRQTSLGPVFAKNIERLKTVHEDYLKYSDQSSKRLVQIQEDDTVVVWLNECNEVAKELTTAWNLDSLLIKPMQRITKYPDIIQHLLKYTPADHPDREALTKARLDVMTAIEEINKTKKNFELVGQIVGPRKRKESDVRAGLARAFGKRVDKLQVVPKTVEDEEFSKLHERYQDDYLQLQVMLRDVEYYTSSVTTYVHEFLQYLSSMELVMRLQPSREYAHLESKWVQFNVSMRDIEKIALEKHVSFPLALELRVY